MKVKDVIKRLEKYNPEAVLRLGGSKGEEVLFICALAKDDKNVWLESSSMCDLNEEIATRFQQVKNGEITERENYRNLIELGISAEAVKRVMGEKSKYIVAEDLPRTQVPGRTKKWEKTIKICFLSRICEHKGLDILIDALLQIQGYNIEFSIFGPIQEKEYWNTCEEKLKQIEISWTYKGDVPSEEVQSVLSTQDILVLPTKSENYGHVVFEALSVGCIPIISDRTPWSLVESWNAGYVVSRTQEAFSRALTEYLSMSIEDKNEMVDHAVELAKYKVEQSKMKTGYREIFELRGN